MKIERPLYISVHFLGGNLKYTESLTENGYAW